jgi:hypothetical protein
VTKNHNNTQKMKKLLQIIRQQLTGSTRYANPSDILGRKSGGTRDSNKVDWYAPVGSNA